LKAQAAAEKQAAKESKRTQQKLPKNAQKQSYIVKLPLKVISNSSAKAVTFAEDVGSSRRSRGVQNWAIENSGD
jgi:hypothetical protein